MSQSKTIEISKIEAAKRQLETAITLYFSNGEPVSIHTLAAAALESIRGTAKKRGIRCVRDYPEYLLKPEHVKETRDKLKEAENFFKHGDKNEKKTLQFSPKQTDFILLDACLTYEALASGQTGLMKVFCVWFALQHPSTCNPPGEIGAQFRKLSGLPNPTRQEFFATARPFLPQSSR